MKSKTLLTSIAAIVFAVPAIAEPSHSSNTFPDASQGQYMQEDYTYTNAATAANMDGVYSGTVDAEAQYEDIIYNIAAGRYLAAASELTNGTECPANSWCPGISGIYYNANNAQGLNSCPNGYANSAAGADEATDCYRTCTTGDVAHSAAVTGMMYYNGTNGDGVNACEPTSTNGCVNGYHYVAGGSNPDLMTLIGTTDRGIDSGSADNDGQSPTLSESMYNLIDHERNKFAVDYGSKGIITGHARCSTRSATNPWVGTNGIYVLQSDSTVSELTDETGQTGANYCYCQLDSYIPVSGNPQTLSGPWVFYNPDPFDDCDVGCAGFCAGGLQDADTYNLAFRAAVFGAYPAGLAQCEANTITIDWKGTTQTEIEANNAGSVTYGGNINTPRSATPVPGKTFKGWRFSAPQSNNNSGNNNG